MTWSTRSDSRSSPTTARSRLARPGFATREDLRRWADSIGSAAALPRLIRRLVLETGEGLTEVNFPAAEGTRVGDWDGTVRATNATAFVPAGLSGWELSVDKRAAAKAEKDYQNRVESPDGSATTDCAYVAVSLRVWTERKEFAARHNREERWKEVKALALDGIDTWLDDAPITHAWISEELGLGPHGVKTVESWWKQWSSATNPALPRELMLAGRASEVNALRTALSGAPVTLTISAASRDEVLAFIAAFAYSEEVTGNASLLARTAFVDEVTTWRSLIERERPLLLVPASDAVVGEAVGRHAIHHVIVPVPRAATAEIQLQPIDSAAAAELLKPVLGEKEGEAVARLARISLTVARRRLAVNRALHEPEWARVPVDRAARRLLLAGRWNSASDSDKAIVSGLLGVSVEQLADATVKYAAGDDPLLARIGASISVISPYDAWLLLRSQLTTDDLTTFRALALEVLGARDPALDLPPDERYKANIVGKARQHSSDLRDGLATSLALLGAVGDRKLTDSAMTGADWAGVIVRELLSKANEAPTADAWASLDDVLPRLAEAAPDEFLREVARGLEGERPLLAGMFVDRNLGIFGHASHTGLLWALEACAWSPDHFGQAVDLLARLAEIDPGGRLANRPFRSLDEIFCAWHPQNSVDNKRRLDVIDGLRERHPEVAWKLLMSLLPESHAVSGYTYAPNYRTWKPAKEPGFVPGEYWPLIRGIFDRVLEDVGEDADRWQQLVADLGNLPPDLREQALTKLGTLAGATTLDEKARTIVRDALQRFVRHHREFPDADWALPAADLAPIAALTSRFEPESPRARHAWLFTEQMPSIDTQRLQNWENYQKDLARLRAQAAREIVEASSWDDVLDFARRSKVPGEFGAAVAASGAKRYEAELIDLLDAEDPIDATFARGHAVKRIEAEPFWYDAVAGGTLSPRRRARLILALWDLPKEWAALANGDPHVEEHYWREFPRFRGEITNEQLRTIVGGLRSVGRVAAAVDLLAMSLPKEHDADLADLAAAVLEEFLEKAGSDKEAAGLQGYDFTRLFEYLDLSPAIDRTRVARLEWAYLPALEHQGRRFLLHRAMADDPALFVDLIARMFRARREEGEEEEIEDETPPDDAAKNAATNAFRLLYEWRTVPGSDDERRIDGEKLRQWIAQARRQLAERRRTEVGDIYIGHILAHGPTDPDGTWPTRTIRDLIEELRNERVEDGFRTETINSRGVTSRALESGGRQERDLVARYRELADKVTDRWPRTAILLRALADSYDFDARRGDDQAERFRTGWEGPGVGPVPTPEAEKDEVMYFAYGSNMSTGRIGKRLGPVKKRAIARLADYAIEFDKASTDGSGKTNLVPKKSSEAWGVIFDLTPDQMQKLKRIEKGYTEQGIEVDVDGNAVPVRTLVAEKRTRRLRPTHEYLNLLIEGAEEHGLPGAYVQKLRRVRTG